jgi:ATP-dependent protease Clp ATPase subunit
MKATKSKKTTKRRATTSGKGSPNWAAYVITYEALLGKSIIGQANAIQRLSSIMASHAIRDKVTNPTQAARVLIIGPPSSGKTFAVDNIVKHLNLNTTVVNCSGYSPPGYKGYDLSTAIKSLISEAGLGSQQRAENHSCMVFDEFDKLKRRGRDDSFIKQIEFSLLPVFNGEKILIDSEEYGESVMQFSTFNSLIFAMGVFPEIPKNVWTDTHKARAALVKYGFSPEMVSRMTHFICFDQLDRSSCATIVDTEVEALSKMYQSKDDIPTVSKNEKAKLISTTLKSQFGIRGARVQIHEILEKKAHGSAVENMM